MPVRIHLQTTQKCNFRCIMCTRQKPTWRRPRALPCMDEDLLRKVAHEGFPYADSVDLTVSGEPLLATNLAESLRLVRLHNVALNITTNGSLLGRPGMLEQVAPSLGLLTVSLDAASAETLGAIRPGARFDEITTALCRYAEMRRKGETGGRLEIAAVLMRRNVTELPDMVRLARSLSADAFVGAHMVVVSDEIRSESLLGYPGLYNRYRAEALRVAASLGQIAVLPPPLDVSPSQRNLNKDVEKDVEAGPVPGPIRCPFAHRSLYIQTEGSAMPCCNEDPDLPIMGNLRRQTIREIWNSPQYLELRRGLRSGHLTSYCRRCYIIADQIRLAGLGLVKAS
ncbi:MAG: SPASM domain-containing protein [Armatimonadota bacterium]|nr:MAG: SPASM domain-containing protein [Armatimonadota bacterium]